METSKRKSEVDEPIGELISNVEEKSENKLEERFQEPVFLEKPNREGFVRNLILKNPKISHSNIMKELVEKGMVQVEGDKKSYVFHKTNTSSLFGLLKTNLKRKGMLLKVEVVEGEKCYWIDEDPNFVPKEKAK